MVAGRGGGGGAGRGEGAEYAPRPATTIPTAEHISADSVAADLGKMEISQLPSAPRSQPEAGKLVPIRRPDGGGTAGTHTIRLLVNHFPLRFDDEMVIYHYDINIVRNHNSIEGANAASTTTALDLTRAELSAVKFERFKDLNVTVAYDGEKNLFSPVELPVGSHSVEGVRGRAYTVTVRLQKQVRLGELRRPPCPREILQGLDVILKDNSRRERIVVGRGFYSPKDGRPLGWGVFASEGFQQSIKDTENGPALCVDHSVMAFWQPLMVLDFLTKVCNIPVNEHTQLNPRQRINVQRALKGLRIVVTHRDSKRKFPVVGLTDMNANDIIFVDKDSKKEIRLVNYFRDTYKKEIQYKKLPCLSLNKNREIYVPMEFCRLAEGQICPKEKLDKNAEQTLRGMALVGPKVRKDLIRQTIEARDGPCRGKVLQEFHMDVSTDPTKVTCRVLQRPPLKLNNTQDQPCKFLITNNDCQWNLLKNKVASGMRIDRWAIADFSASQRSNIRLDVNAFAYKLAQRCQGLGIRMEKPLFIDRFNMDILSDPRGLYGVLMNVKEKAAKITVGGRLQILICPMADRHEGYKTLKLIADTDVGIKTQCCLSYHANQGKDQYLANLALKINAKVGGSNIELYDSLPKMVDVTSPVIFIGADVNHPKSFDANSPSIAAVVATMNWPASSSYAAKVQAQPHRRENIINVGQMCRELIDKFAELNRKRPRRIIYFRDGVSDSQFDMVLNRELMDIKAEILSAVYQPTITVVVAQKRHQTRFFPEGRDVPLCTKSGNVPPGTVVDTGIVAPYLFNFFLCSHNGILGTSKPTHYYVLWDEHGFTSDELQKLTFNLCFTFARCTKPVSLVPPVYYADLVAYRGRVYLEGQSMRSPTLSASSSSSFVPGNFPKLHEDVEDGMFFV